MLEEPVFAHEHSGISMLVHGAGTQASVNSGTITGRTQRVSVQAGASLEASDLTIIHVEVTGVEAKDEDSFVKLTRCNLHGFSDQVYARLENGWETTEDVWVRGVYVHCSSTAELCSISVTGQEIACGVAVCTSASATLAGCGASASR